MKSLNKRLKRVRNIKFYRSSVSIVSLLFWSMLPIINGVGGENGIPIEIYRSRNLEENLSSEVDTQANLDDQKNITLDDERVNAITFDINNLALNLDANQLIPIKKFYISAYMQPESKDLVRIHLQLGWDMFNNNNISKLNGKTIYIWDILPIRKKYSNNISPNLNSLILSSNLERHYAHKKNIISNNFSISKNNFFDTKVDKKDLPFLQKIRKRVFDLMFQADDVELISRFYPTEFYQLHKNFVYNLSRISYDSDLVDKRISYYYNSVGTNYIINYLDFYEKLKIKSSVNLEPCTYNNKIPSKLTQSSIIYSDDDIRAINSDKSRPINDDDFMKSSLNENNLSNSLTETNSILGDSLN